MGESWATWFKSWATWVKSWARWVKSWARWVNSWATWVKSLATLVKSWATWVKSWATWVKSWATLVKSFFGLFLISELILNMVDCNCFSYLCAIYLSTIDNLQFFLAFLSFAYFFQNHFFKLFQEYHKVSNSLDTDQGLTFCQA